MIPTGQDGEGLVSEEMVERAWAAAVSAGALAGAFNEFEVRAALAAVAPDIAAQARAGAERERDAARRTLAKVEHWLAVERTRREAAEAALAQARADGADEERERIKGLLQRAADGRTEYASSGGPADQVAVLQHEANAFTNAVRLCDDLSVMLGLLPSWRWTPEESALSWSES